MNMITVKSIKLVFATLIVAVGLTVLGAILGMGSVLAQDKVVYKKRTVIDLSGAVIKGELTRPEGSYIVNRKLSKFSTLIKARGNYLPELMTSHNDL